MAPLVKKHNSFCLPQQTQFFFLWFNSSINISQSAACDSPLCAVKCVCVRSEMGITRRPIFHCTVLTGERHGGVDQLLQWVVDMETESMLLVCITFPSLSYGSVCLKPCYCCIFWTIIRKWSSPRLTQGSRVGVVHWGGDALFNLALQRKFLNMHIYGIYH